MDNTLLSEFTPQTIDKVERLIDLLDEFAKHHALQNKLALYGGTAINLFMLNVPRLSVDIDLAYVGAVSKDAMMADRPIIERSIMEVSYAQGYSVSGREDSHAGRSFVLGYDSPWGRDHVKVDCNYMYRSPLLPLIECEAALRQGTRISTFSSAELIGGKVKAFFDRIKMRDLYDIANLKLLLDSLHGEEIEVSRKTILFYASLSSSFPRGFEGRPDRFLGRSQELEEQLTPMLRRQSIPLSLEELIETAHAFVRDYVIPTNDSEREYLARFAAGYYDPFLLFTDKEMAKAASKNPVAQWKLRNLQLKN